MKKVGKNDQRGLAHLMLIAMVLVVGGVIGFAAWRVSSSSNDNTGTKNSTGSSAVTDSAAIDACNKEIKDKDFCKFAGTYKLDGISYHMKINATSPDGNSVTEMDIDSKNNSSMAVTQGGKEAAAYISLNGVTYMKDLSSGTWIKYPASENSAPKEDNPAEDVKINTNDITEKNTISYKSLGKEACDNLKCFKYQVVDSTQPKSEQFIWFDTKDYRMQRWTSKDDSGTSDMTITYKAVTIKAPSPVKDFSAQSSAEMQAAAQAAAAAADTGDE